MEAKEFIKKRERDNPTLGLKFVYATNARMDQENYSTATSLWFKSEMNHLWIFTRSAKKNWIIVTVISKNEMEDLIKVFKELMK